MSICQVDCLSTYSCNAQVIGAYDGAIFEPWVELTFGKNMSITGGNKSSPPNNLATIRSFSYGQGGGGAAMGAEFEIIDVGGTMYRQIIKAVNKTIANSKGDAQQCYFDFGWIIKKCNGSIEVKKASDFAGGVFHAFFQSVETSFEGNNIKMKITMTPPSAIAKQSTQNNTEGDESNKITLKNALINIYKLKEPSYNDVKFRSKDDDGSGGFRPFEFKNSDGGPDGPKSSWPLNQQSTLAAGRNWLNSLLTNNDRGLQFFFDPVNYNIIIQEDKLKKSKCCQNNIGTYIVNGGNCSPVLEFNPHFKWSLTGQSTGAANPGAASGSSQQLGDTTSNIQKTGSQAQPTIAENNYQWRSPDEMASRSAEAMEEQYKANVILEGLHVGTEAELKLMGDPQYNNLANIFGKTISLVVINPFYLGKQCTWLTTSNCNPILSNKNWYINSFSHQITSGSFITILKIQLTGPNQQLSANETLGGCGKESFTESPGASEAKDASDQ